LLSKRGLDGLEAGALAHEAGRVMDGRGKRRILIVEDQAILGMELEFALEQAGYEVVGIAVDSRQALALAAETRPELAVVDISLKDGKTGVMVADSIASQFGVSVLFATAEPEMIPDQFARAFGVVVKPYSAPSVHAAVDYCLALRDGSDPGPAPYQLRLAPWITAAIKRDGDGDGNGRH
jgi:DNA-binding response OmpR family regulator